jgi:hypothetical protein
MSTFEKIYLAVFIYLTVQILVLLLVIGCHYLYIKEIIFVPILVSGMLTWFVCCKLFK